MIYATDTDFLVAVEIRDHEFHKVADALLAASCATRGISVIRTNSDKDSGIFGRFEILGYKSDPK